MEQHIELSTVKTTMRARLFAFDGVRVSAIALLGGAALFAVIMLGSSAGKWVARFFAPDLLHTHRWLGACASHVSLTFVSLLLIAALVRIRKGDWKDFGVCLPQSGATSFSVRKAVLFGIAFGIIMGVPDLLLGVPSLPKRSHVVGDLFFQGVVVGPSEELAMRGLMIGFLARHVSGTVTLAGLKIGTAGVLAAVLFSLAHADSFVHAPFIDALSQQVYAFAFAIAFAWMLERSRSLLAPSISHNVADFVSHGLMYTFAALHAA